jgi:hypothetical protein
MQPAPKEEPVQRVKRFIKSILIIAGLVLFFLIAPTECDARSRMGGRVSIVLNPGMEKGVDYGLGGELGWYSDKSWTFITIGGSISYNPWEETFPMMHFINVVQGVAKWLAIGVSGFYLIPLPERRFYPGVVGLVDFLIKDFDIALFGGALWSPDPGPAFGIQFGCNFTVI